MLRMGLLGAAAAGAMLLAAGPSARAADPYDIHVVLPLTGGAAFVGNGERQALQQMEKQLAAAGVTIGGRAIHFVVHDDQTSPQVAVQVANEILRISPKPSVILGSTLVGMCNAMAPLMRNGPVMYCFSPGLYPARDSYVFSSSVATRDLATSLIRYYRKEGWTRIALITSTDASGQDALRNIRELMALEENKDLQLVADATFNPGDMSVAAQVQRLKSSGAQALIAWTSGSPIGTVFRGIADGAWDVPVGTTDSNMTYAQMTQYAAILPARLFIPASVWPVDAKVKFSPEIEAAKHAYADAFAGLDVKPDSAGTFAWDPAALVVAALRKLGPEATAAQVRVYIAETKAFVGVNGSYDFTKVPQRGLDDSNVVVTRWNKATMTWDIVSHAGGAAL